MQEELKIQNQRIIKKKKTPRKKMKFQNQELLQTQKTKKKNRITFGGSSTAQDLKKIRAKLGRINNLFSHFGLLYGVIVNDGRVVIDIRKQGFIVRKRNE